MCVKAVYDCSNQTGTELTTMMYLFQIWSLLFRNMTFDRKGREHTGVSPTQYWAMVRENL